MCDVKNFINSPEQFLSISRRASIIHTEIHTYIHTNIHTHIHTYMRIHIHIHTYIHTYIHAYMYGSMHTYIHTFIHTHIHTILLRYVRVNKGKVKCREGRLGLVSRLVSSLKKS